MGGQRTEVCNGPLQTLLQADPWRPVQVLTGQAYVRLASLGIVGGEVDIDDPATAAWAEHPLYDATVEYFPVEADQQKVAKLAEAYERQQAEQWNAQSQAWREEVTRTIGERDIGHAISFVDANGDDEVRELLAGGLGNNPPLIRMFAKAQRGKLKLVGRKN